MNNLKIGDVLHGFCNGYFGRDDYDCKRVEIVAADYVVLRYVDISGVTILQGPIEQKLIDDWKNIDEHCGYAGCVDCANHLGLKNDAHTK